MRILVVDDSRTMRMLVTRTLRQAGYGDHEIVEAGDGVEALEVIGRTQVDAVLCDWNMPRMNGLELLRALRGAGDMRLFGFITSETNAGVRKIAEHDGAAFVISKPFTAETLKTVLSGGAIAQHAAIFHEGLPTPADLQQLLETLLGREVDVRPSERPVEAPDAALLWSYSFPDGRLAAVGALDLPCALSLGAALGLLPANPANMDPPGGVVPTALLENVREVLNVLAGLYHSLSDLPLRLSAVWGPAVGRDEEIRVLAHKTGRLDATINVPGYRCGRFAAVYALIAT